MARFKRGELHSGKSKKPVKNKKQALAIALNACGESKYSENLQSMGYPAEVADQVTALFAEMNWDKQFETGKSAAKNKTGNLDTGEVYAKNAASSKIGLGVGNNNKNKQPSAEMLSGVALPKGPANPMGGSSKDVQGLRQLG